MPKDLGNTQDLVFVEDIRQDTVILKNGSLRQVIMVGGINFALKSELEQNVITQAYQDFLNSVDFPLQIVVHSRKVNIEKYLESLSRYEAQAASPLLQNQVNEYKEFIKSFVTKNAVMEKIFLVIVPFAPLSLPSKESVTKALPFFKKGKDKEAEEKAKEEARQNFEANLLQLKQPVGQVLDGLYSIGLEAAVLNTEQLIQLFYNFYNPETVERKEMQLPT